MRDGSEYHNRYAWMIELEGSLVRTVHEYMDTAYRDRLTVPDLSQCQRQVKGTRVWTSSSGRSGDAVAATSSTSRSMAPRTLVRNAVSEASAPVRDADHGLAGGEAGRIDHPPPTVDGGLDDGMKVHGIEAGGIHRHRAGSHTVGSEQRRRQVGEVATHPGATEGVATAPSIGRVAPGTYAMLTPTQLATAARSSCPSSPPNSARASGPSRSDSQYRLGRTYSNQSSSVGGTLVAVPVTLAQ